MTKRIVGQNQAKKEKEVALELPVKLNGIQLEGEKDKLVAADQRLSQLDGAKKAFLLDHNVKVEKATIEKNEALKLLTEGVRMEMVPCRIVPDFERNRIVTIRTDTNEEVGEERAMTAKEREELAQVAIPGTESNGAEART